jgi:hypothetical protein
LWRAAHVPAASHGKGKGVLVGNPVVHFEIIGKNPERLRN